MHAQPTAPEAAPETTRERKPRPWVRMSTLDVVVVWFLGVSFGMSALTILHAVIR